MLNLKKLAALAMSLAMLTVSFTGCSEESEAEKNSTAASEFVELEDLPKPSKETGKVANFTAPEKGEEIIVMKIKDYGDIKIKLFNEQAPAGSKNFSYHASTGYYDGLIFHRIINNFMIQGGDPMGNGMGGPGYCIKGEFAKNGFENNLKHTLGVLSMARRAMPLDSAGSQFFIMVADCPFLDGDYATFGKVTEGIDVVLNIVKQPTDFNDKPTVPQVMKKVTVETFGVEYPEPEKIAE